jgi:hypothetical protein
MIRVCAWCGKLMDSRSGGASPVTHGMCPSCADTFFVESGEPMSNYLDRLGVPVLVTDANVRVMGANTQACEALGKNLSQLQSRMGGQVIECTHAAESEGCGGTVHCRSCTIRNTVRHTFETGEPCVRIRAYPDIQSGNGIRSVCLEISTEKVGGVVMLRIDDLRDQPPGEAR